MERNFCAAMKEGGKVVQFAINHLDTKIIQNAKLSLNTKVRAEFVQTFTQIIETSRVILKLLGHADESLLRYKVSLCIIIPRGQMF